VEAVRCGAERRHRDREHVAAVRDGADAPAVADRAGEDAVAGGCDARILVELEHSVGARPKALSAALVHGDHARAAETDVVLQRDLRARDLTLLAAPEQLARELEALADAGRAEGVAFGEQASRRVHD